MTEPDAPVADDGPLGRGMVRGTAVQQGSTVIALLVGLITTTALARSLTLKEFGVYGFVVALATYLYFAAGTAETAAVNEMAAAPTEKDRDRAFTLSIVVYAGLAAVAAILIAAGGALLVRVLDVSPALEHQARLGCIAVGLATMIGWIGKVFQDLLRATHRFSAAAGCEIAGTVVLGAAVVAALALGAPLWVVIAAGAATPLYVGAIAVVVVTVSSVHWAFRPAQLHLAEIRRFLRFSGGVLVIAASDVVVSSLDRVVVGALRPAATLGLYEAANRMNVLIRSWVGNLSVTLLPVLTGLNARGEHQEKATLLIRGTRYMLPTAVGPTVALMVLSDRILAVWLGMRYVPAAPAAAVFLTWWLVAPNLSVASTMLIVDRNLRQLRIYAWSVALVNLVLSVALTAWLGLIGVAIGTTGAYLLLVPYFASFAFKGRGVKARDLAGAAWIPAYTGGILLAAGLLALRLAVPLDHVWSVVAAIVGGVGAYWLAFYVLVLRPDERDLVRSIARRT